MKTQLDRKLQLLEPITSYITGVNCSNRSCTTQEQDLPTLKTLTEARLLRNFRSQETPKSGQFEDFCETKLTNLATFGPKIVYSILIAQSILNYLKVYHIVVRFSSVVYW